MWKRKAQKTEEEYKGGSGTYTVDNKAIEIGGSSEFSTGGVVSTNSTTYNNIYDNRLTNTDLSYRNYSTWTKTKPGRSIKEIAAMPELHNHIIKLLEQFNDTGDLDELKVQDLIDAIIYMHGD